MNDCGNSLTSLYSSTSVVDTTSTSYVLLKTVDIATSDLQNTDRESFMIRTHTYGTVQDGSNTISGTEKVEVVCNASTVFTGTGSAYMNSTSVPDYFVDLTSISGTTTTINLYGKARTADCKIENNLFEIAEYRKKELTWDGTTYVNEYTESPPWIIYDLLTNTRYGLGIDESRIDIDTFYTAAKYCDALVTQYDDSDLKLKRFALSVNIDSFKNNAMDLLNTLCASFRGHIIWYGGKIKLIIDKEEDPVQIFNMSNIIKDSFKESFADIKTKYNVATMIFANRQNDYKKTAIRVEDYESLVENNDPLRETKLDMMGIVDRNIVMRNAVYALRTARYCSRAVSFSVPQDALTCYPGQVVLVQHDVPQWGFGGRVLSGGINWVELDRSVDIESGTTYQIKIRHSDDTIETKTVTNSAGNSQYRIYVDSNFSTIPEQNSLWIFGEVSVTSKPFRIVSIQRTGLTQFNLQLLEYNANVYNDTYKLSCAYTNYSTLGKTLRAKDLAAEEKWFVNKDGTVDVGILLTYTLPTDTSFNEIHIYRADGADSGYYFIGSTKANSYLVKDSLTAGNTYYFKITSTSTLGHESNIASSSPVYLTFVGKSEPPEDVTNFVVTQNYDRINLSWTVVSDDDLDFYEVRRGSTWDSADVVFTTKQTAYTLLHFPFGDVTYWIKARDTSGNYSTNANYERLYVEDIPGRNKVLTIIDYSLSGTLSGDAVIEYNDMHSDMFRKCVLLSTVNVYDNSHYYDTTLTYDSPVELEGYYTLDAYDLGYKANINISTNIEVYADGSSASYEIQERHSDDNITWTAWAALSSTTAINFRYIQFRIKLSTTDATQNVRLFSFSMILDVPDVIERYHDTTIPSTGLTITFTKEFHTDDVDIVVTPTDNNYIAKITGISRTGCTITLYTYLETDGDDLTPTTGTAVEGKANILISGW